MNTNIKNMLMVVLAIIFLIAAEWNSERREVYEAVVDDRGIQPVEMTAENDFFKPNTVIVKMNIPVEITIRKQSGVIQHNFVLEEPEAGISVKEELSEKSKTILFTPKMTGKFAFYCDKGVIETHRENGMEGILEVKE